MVLFNRCLERIVTRGQITFCEIFCKDHLQRLGKERQVFMKLLDIVGDAIVETIPI